MTFDVTQIILALIALCGAVVTGVVVPWVKAKTTTAQQEQLGAWVRIAVAAAEQIFAAGNGAEKKKYVVRWLEERGIVFDEDTIDAAIEAAVYDLKK